jgi:hypothetical protein
VLIGELPVDVRIQSLDEQVQVLLRECGLL